MTPSDIASAPTDSFVSLELLSSAVILLNQCLCIEYMNSSAENLFAASRKHVRGTPVTQLVGENNAFRKLLHTALETKWNYTDQDLMLLCPDGTTLHLNCQISAVDSGTIRLVLEMHPIDAQIRVAREEYILLQQQASRELMRNLAHEIKNPLGGIRGSAQLLERELHHPELREYTDVIISEADRLQNLMNHILTPHTLRHPVPMDIHDILEHIRKLMLAEFTALTFERDYDISIPSFTADPEQLIQALLNIARNAAQATQGQGKIIFRTRVARQVTMAKRRYRLALELQITDNGSGIPERIRDKIFFPLVSGREGGSGLGLSLSQTIIEQHHGLITVESAPGHTCFTILLPIQG